MAGKDRIAFRRFANIPAENDRTPPHTQLRDGSELGVCRSSVVEEYRPPVPQRL